MAYFINYCKFNEIRKHNHKHSNVSQEHISLPLKAIHVTLTGSWICRFPQVKSAEHIANLISVSDRAHFPIYLEHSIKNL